MLDLVAHRFRMLGDSTRLRLLQCLESGGKSVNEITALLDGNQPNISKHLQALSDAGLVHRSRSGNRIYYSIADPVVFKLCALVCNRAGQQARSELKELLSMNRKS
ncbi:MAG TPA: metalloregulator ArsR/SmtB family transcription factor [Candidatus Acidoferrum sp.]|jgi:DNA-binding transcriptional ArsR family regulator